MKVKLLFTVLVGFVLSIGSIVFVNAQGTNLTSPTTDFGRDVKSGIDSTKNDPIAKQEQKDADENEAEEAQEDAEKVEAKEAEEAPEAPEAAETSEAEESGDSGGGETKKSDSGSGTETGGSTTENNNSSN